MNKEGKNPKENFIPNYFIWLSPQEQKRRVKKLQKITKNRKKESN